MKPSAKALFLDRDGTLIEHIPYLHDPERVRLVKGARNALQAARKGGFKLFLFTNQSGVGRGMFPMKDVEACNQRMRDLLNLPEEIFTRECIAPEKPGDPIVYRKPSPRFILEMIEEHKLDPDYCWMIGDSDCDVESALNAGIKFFRVGDHLTLIEAVEKAVGAKRKL